MYYRSLKVCVPISKLIDKSDTHIVGRRLFFKRKDIGFIDDLIGCNEYYDGKQKDKIILDLNIENTVFNDIKVYLKDYLVLGRKKIFK